jgi:hypothetical protein
LKGFQKVSWLSGGANPFWVLQKTLSDKVFEKTFTVGFYSKPLRFPKGFYGCRKTSQGFSASKWVFTETLFLRWGQGV